MASGNSVLLVATVYTHLAAFHIPFMRLLQSWGYEVHAAASPAEGRKDEVEAAGVTCRDVPFARSLTSIENGRAYRLMRRLLRDKKFNLIHVHTPVAAWLTRAAARGLRQGPVLYTAHGFHFFRGAPWTHWALFYPLERLAVRWTDGLIVLNREDFERAKRMRFVEGENVFLVHGVGVDLEAFKPDPRARDRIRSELGLRADDLVALCVAEFTPTKNHRQLLLAWKRVAKEEPSAQLLLVGNGRLRQREESRVIRDQVRNVRFLGFRRDVPSLLAAADLLVLPSRREGLPRSILEAMAVGLPVVATDVRGCRDLVEHGRNGLLVKVGDVEGLAQAIVTLLGDRELRERMGREGRTKVEAYSLDRVLEETAAIYRRFLPAPGGA